MSYQKSAYNSNSGAPTQDAGEEKVSKTTHYAYRLIRDAEGNVDKTKGQNGKEYVNSLQIFENEGKFGKYLKIRVTGPVPADDIFVNKKRDK